jgi:hypothetical protein
MSIRRSALIVVFAGLLAAGLGGCAAGNRDDAAAPAGSATVSSEPSGGPIAPEPSMSASAVVPIPNVSQPSGEVTLKGAVQAGVEGGCVVLKTSDKLYLLVGGDRDQLQKSIGTNVSVTGQVVVGMMTTCQQGTPFRVTHIQPA